MDHILVTGGAGYLGSILCEHLLDAGYQVTVVDNLMYQQKSLFHLCANPQFDFVFGDARHERLMHSLVKKADVLIPMAGIVGVAGCERDPWLAKTVNLEAVRLLNRLRSPQQLVVIPTTNSGYGTNSGKIVCTEDTPLEPISLYGRTKVKAEAEMLATANVISLRLATVFGMSPRLRIDLLVNHFVCTAITEGFIVIFEKNFKRNYIHIRDVADCILHCLEHSDQMVGRPYNLGLDDANYSKEELALKVKEYVPDFYIHFSDSGRDPDQRNYIVSNQRLHEAGFVARRSLDAGIKELLKGYRIMGRSQFKNK